MKEPSIFRRIIGATGVVYIRFIGAVGGIAISGLILLLIALPSSFFIDDMSFLFKKEVMVTVGVPFAILGAAFPKYTKWIGDALLTHWN